VGSSDIKCPAGQEESKTVLSAKKLFFLGAVAFWLPEIILELITKQLAGGKALIIILPTVFLAVYFVVLVSRPGQIAKPSAAIFMVLGVLFLGTLAITIGATILGGGFRTHPGSSVLGVLLGTVIPVYAFIGATYDGSLYALIFVSLVMPLMHLAFERKNWIIPPKRADLSL
jgi:Na+-translocating ferredoxin:NAD+ oxidoreductase RnfD subunit